MALRSVASATALGGRHGTASGSSTRPVSSRTQRQAPAPRCLCIESSARAARRHRGV